MSKQLNETNDVNDDTVTDDDLTDDTGDAPEWTPPSKDEWDALIAKENKASAEAASRKRWLREAGINPRTGERAETPSAEASTSTDDSRNYREDLRSSEQIGLKKGVSIYAKLVSAGVNPKRVDAVLKFLDVDGITVDEDGIEGIDEQIADLKEDYPEFFKRERMKTSDASVVGAGKKTASSATQTSWEDAIRDRFNQGLI